MRILIADDDLQVRGALRLLIEQQFDNAVVDEISRAGQLLETSLTSNPDVILLDLELPGSDRHKLLQETRCRWPAAVVIAMSALPESKREAMVWGATAFISKNDPPAAFIPLLRPIAAA